MADLEYRLLSADELESGLAGLPGWKVENGEIAKTFEFKNYKDGLVFAVAAGYLADRLDHHPNLLVTYGKVRISVNTHSVEGLSPYDLELARRIERIV
ncbi:4a-hydroxytetrahydrobiopterin dehydratase [Fimbriimonas ginsengisoli]|uniref:Putative pterin-4-alpha-carbinolamine dehydratase n=1 Tax=Fimbriimonas ginsengisoli Gsoil 348 TaxID=661478 RepID=A0A068NSM5_FIMGI|nr:4a-hydroxytetrahydrobiopterin dehydratase [Fimbriimonas ginsengisoli]AIE86441.1 transcriptional coactivator/pterin dehydratase [Fimbriimonas ginsengisoli Gsoil 348]